MNLGYVYYRKDSGETFSLGIMQPERGEGYAPWGATDDIWNKSDVYVAQQRENYALYNAPPGTLQRMAVYYYLSTKDDRATQQAVLAYTHDDVFKPVPGFKVVSRHFHLDFNEQLRDRGTLTISPAGFRSFGIWVSTFSTSATSTTTQIHVIQARNGFMEEKIYFEGSQRVSDKDFLVMPAEEPNAYLGGHWYLLTPKPVYFSHAEPRPKTSRSRRKIHLWPRLSSRFGRRCVEDGEPGKGNHLDCPPTHQKFGRLPRWI